MFGTSTRTSPFREVRERLNGKVCLPDHGRWDDARKAWNLAVDQHPEAVVFPESVDDVIAAVNFARDRGLRVNVQGTGHNAAALGSMEGTILIKPTAMGGVDIDADALTVRVGPAALWSDVSDPASELGLLALAGSARDVGVVGYTLGGGLSFLARKYGLASNRVKAIEVVTAEGELVRADHEHHEDLFWALRGGGGSFGVVTAMELELFRIPQVYAGMMLWPWDRASEVLEGWYEMLPTLPDEATTVGRIVQTPPLPEIPEPLRGRQFAMVEMFYLGDEASGAELLRPLRELGPEIDTVAMVPPGALGYIHMDPPEPVPYHADARLLADPGKGVIDTLVETAGPDAGCGLISVELRQLGGALSRTEPGHGAIRGLDADFNMFAVGLAADEAGMAATVADCERVMDGYAPVEREVDPATLYRTDDYARLRELKSSYDPGAVFRGNHDIPAA
jgi:FAD/FMN-containing dehydrogenase